MNENDLRAFIYGMKLARPTLTITVDECVDRLDYLLEMSKTEAFQEIHLNTGLSQEEITDYIATGKRFVQLERN